MSKSLLAAAILGLGLAGCAQAQEGGALPEAPPGGDYQKVSDLVPLPEFLPGLGTLYVQPETLPAGPFLGYDQDGTLVNTIYMVPVADIEGQKSFEGLEAAAAPVREVDMYYNAGHPGVEAPHYHVVLWHGDRAQVAAQ